MFCGVVLLRQDPKSGIEYMHSGFHTTHRNEHNHNGRYTHIKDTAYSTYNNVKRLVAI